MEDTSETAAQNSIDFIPENAGAMGLPEASKGESSELRQLLSQYDDHDAQVIIDEFNKFRDRNFLEDMLAEPLITQINFFKGTSEARDLMAGLGEDKLRLSLPPDIDNSNLGQRFDPLSSLDIPIDLTEVAGLDIDTTNELDTSVSDDNDSRGEILNLLEGINPRERMAIAREFQEVLDSGAIYDHVPDSAPPEELLAAFIALGMADKLLKEFGKDGIEIGGKLVKSNTLSVVSELATGQAEASPTPESPTPVLPVPASLENELKNVVSETGDKDRDSAQETDRNAPAAEVTRGGGGSYGIIGGTIAAVADIFEKRNQRALAKLDNIELKTYERSVEETNGKMENLRIAVGGIKTLQPSAPGEQKTMAVDTLQKALDDVVKSVSAEATSGKSRVLSGKIGKSDLSNACLDRMDECNNIMQEVQDSAVVKADPDMSSKIVTMKAETAEKIRSMVEKLMQFIEKMTTGRRSAPRP